VVKVVPLIQIAPERLAVHLVFPAPPEALQLAAEPVAAVVLAMTVAVAAAVLAVTVALAVMVLRQLMALDFTRQVSMVLALALVAVAVRLLLLEQVMAVATAARGKATLLAVVVAEPLFTAQPTLRPTVETEMASNQPDRKVVRGVGLAEAEAALGTTARASLPLLELAQ
jgi:hypothetical protein